MLLDRNAGGEAADPDIGGRERATFVRDADPGVAAAGNCKPDIPTEAPLAIAISSLAARKLAGVSIVVTAAPAPSSVRLLVMVTGSV